MWYGGKWNAMSQAMQRVNKQILQPKGMKLLNTGCWTQAIELPSSSPMAAEAVGKEQAKIIMGIMENGKKGTALYFHLDSSLHLMNALAARAMA